MWTTHVVAPPTICIWLPQLLYEGAEDEMPIYAHNVAMPAVVLNFCEENFGDQESNREIHENIVPRGS